MSWLTKLLNIDSEDQEYSVPEKFLDVFDKNKTYRNAQLQQMQQEELPQPSEGTTYGPITDTRPENYFGSSFYPEEYFNQQGVPKKEHLTYLEDNILGQTRKAGLPDQLVASQWANESARGTSDDALYRNNPFGLGPHWEFDSVEDATKSYIKTVLNRSGLGEEDEEGNLKLKKGVTAEQVVEALQGAYEMHMEDKTKYGRDIMDTPEWRFYQNNQGGFR